MNNMWEHGVIDGYEYEAKVYDEGSEFGIHDGRISKLSVKDPDGFLVAAYERGWCLNPINKTADIS